MELRALTLENVEQVRLWRNQTLEAWRTPYLLTEEMQENFYYSVVCNRQANSRWWAIYEGEFIGLAGLTDIEWENGLAQIALSMHPDCRGQGKGAEAAEMILDTAFGNMGLATIYGECYECNTSIEFWKKITDRHGGYYTMIPRRKRWQGQLYDALHFSIWR